MRLVNVFERSQKFPDGTGSRYVGLTFEEDGKTLVKNVRVSSCASIASNSGIRKEASYAILKAAREAARDFAYELGGIEAVKKIRFTGLIGDELTERAILLLCQQNNES